MLFFITCFHYFWDFIPKNVDFFLFFGYTFAELKWRWPWHSKEWNEKNTWIN